MKTLIAVIAYTGTMVAFAVILLQSAVGSMGLSLLTFF